MKGLIDGAEIAHPIIHDRDCLRQGLTYFSLFSTGQLEYRLDYKLPLVDGTTPAARGSISKAMRNARPNALKTVSIWW